MGSLAKEKDLIVEYDDSERRARSKRALLAVQSVDEQIKKAKADLAIRRARTGGPAEDAVRRAPRRTGSASATRSSTPSTPRRTCSRWKQQKRALQQLETDIKARQEQADSQLAVLQEQRNRA